MPPPFDLPTSQAVIDVLGERHRQINEEGFHHYHDDGHDDGAMAFAAAALAVCSVRPNAQADVRIGNADHWYHGGWFNIITLIWPPAWDLKWLKPKASRRNKLIRAAALLIAEIERLDRAAEREKSNG